MPGLGELERNVKKLEQANEDMKQEIREAHETIQTARLVIKELRDEHDRWAAGIKKEVDEAVARQVKAGLEEFHNSIKQATREAHAHVIKEFEKITNIMMYGNEKGKGSSILEDWVDKKLQDAVVRTIKNIGPI